MVKQKKSEQCPQQNCDEAKMFGVVSHYEVSGHSRAGGTVPRSSFKEVIKGAYVRFYLTKPNGKTVAKTFTCSEAKNEENKLINIGYSLM